MSTIITLLDEITQHLPAIKAEHAISNKYSATIDRIFDKHTDHREPGAFMKSLMMLVCDGLTVENVDHVMARYREILIALNSRDVCRTRMSKLKDELRRLRPDMYGQIGEKIRLAKLEKKKADGGQRPRISMKQLETKETKETQAIKKGQNGYLGLLIEHYVEADKRGEVQRKAIIRDLLKEEYYSKESNQYGDDEYRAFENLCLKLFPPK